MIRLLCPPQLPPCGPRKLSRLLFFQRLLAICFLKYLLPPATVNSGALAGGNGDDRQGSGLNCLGCQGQTFRLRVPQGCSLSYETRSPEEGSTKPGDLMTQGSWFFLLSHL